MAVNVGVKKSGAKFARSRRVDNWRAKAMHDMTRAERLMSFIEHYCRVPEGDNVGKPMRLADFQVKFIRDVYDNPNGTRRAYLSMARKNAKTATIAALVIGHVCGPEAKQNSQIVSGAMSRDQAALVYSLASKMIHLSPELSGACRMIPSGKRIIGLARNVEYRALAADGTTAHGLSPVLAILDEVGQVQGPQSDFIDAITTSQGAHEHPLLIAISTQSANDADLFSQWLDDAKRSSDPQIVSHVYAAKKGAGLLDRDAWVDANPALGLFRSEADVESQARQASRMPSAEPAFRNLILNQRVSTFAPFVSRGVWELNGSAPAPTTGFRVFAGLDLSARTDLTAFVVVGTDDAGVIQVWPYFWTPLEGLRERSDRDRQPYDVWVREGWLLTTPGRTVDYEFVAKQIADILADCECEKIAFDRWRMDIFKKELDRIDLNLPLLDFGQGFKDMSPAIEKMEELLLNGKLAHGMHPVLTMCAANAAISRDPAGNRKLDKHKATGRIDGMVALAMALGAMSRSEHDGDSMLGFLLNPVTA